MTARRQHVSNRRLGAWHRRLGLAAGAVLVLLVISGMALNHGARLGLDRVYVQSTWLLDWYGIPPPDAPRGVALGGVWLSEVGERIYMNTREVPLARGRLYGAVRLPEGIAAAIGGDVWLLTPSGDVIEHLDHARGMPAAIVALGVDRTGRLVAQTPQGLYAAGRDLSAWHRVARLAVSWGRSAAVPAALQAGLVRQYRGRGLSLERVLIDVHSGRLFGAIGVWFVDAVALCCLGLAVSGLWLWTRRRPQKANGGPA